mmetsp:Transcript_18949/g.53092  ORF Transcript_18949/g.53092 Transcript_18949/m.53092 type:complete len:157 (-) Transcript_18949:772-1242(-)
MSIQQCARKQATKAPSSSHTPLIGGNSTPQVVAYRMYITNNQVPNLKTQLSHHVTHYLAAIFAFFLAALAAFFAAAASAFFFLSSALSVTTMMRLPSSKDKPAPQLQQSAALVPRLPGTVRMSPKYVKFSALQLGQGPLSTMASLKTALVAVVASA